MQPQPAVTTVACKGHSELHSGPSPGQHNTLHYAGRHNGLAVYSPNKMVSEGSLGLSSDSGARAYGPSIVELA